MSSTAISDLIHSGNGYGRIAVGRGSALRGHSNACDIHNRRQAVNRYRDQRTERPQRSAGVPPTSSLHCHSKTPGKSKVHEKSGWYAPIVNHPVAAFALDGRILRAFSLSQLKLYPHAAHLNCIHATWSKSNPLGIVETLPARNRGSQLHGGAR
jgi:hypothetical protein